MLRRRHMAEFKAKVGLEDELAKALPHDSASPSWAGASWKRGWCRALAMPSRAGPARRRSHGV